MDDAIRVVNNYRNDVVELRDRAKSCNFDQLAVSLEMVSQAALELIRRMHATKASA